VLQTPKRLLLGAAGCAVAFVLLLLLVYAPDFGRWADAAALQGFLGLQGPAVAAPSDAIAHLGDPRSFLLIGAGLVLVALARGLPRHALAAVAILAGSNLATQILKPLLATPRDAGEVTGLHIVGPAFPSGHATASMSLAIVAVLVVPRAWRPVVAAIGAVFAIAVSFAIVSLGWHYPSDVVGGWCLALAWVALLSAARRRRRASRS
jgi:membrane-associated phospholipid phosphatase